MLLETDRLKIFPWRLFRRFVFIQLVFTLLILGIVGASARSVFVQWFIRQASTQTQSTLVSLSQDLSGPPEQWCSSHGGGAFEFALFDKNLFSVCSTVSFETPKSDKDLKNALLTGMDSQVQKDKRTQIPVLFTALFVPAKGLVLRTALPLHQLKDALYYFDRTAALLLFVLAGVFLAYSYWAGKKLIFPLGKLLVKARNVLSKSDVSLTPAQEDDLAENPDGEWSDLETAIDQIRLNLRTKTEQLAREREELSTLMTALSDAILAIDREGTPLFFNSRFMLSFGDRDLSSARPRLAEIFRSPEVLEAYQKALEGESVTVQNAELRLKTESVPHHFALSVAPLRREGEPAYGAVGIFHDVTELKKAEQIRIEFVANVSHELRTPLTSIKGYADTLSQDVKEGRFDQTGKYLGTIQRNVDRLMSLISDLLDLSSLESGTGPDPLKSEIDVKEITSRVFAQVDSIREKKEQELIGTYKVARVIASPDRVEQVLTNLLENAIKYVPVKGKINVVWESKGKSVLLRVSDNGPGIPIEHQSRLFERFYRIDKARSREMGGTGLGLAIVKHIMQSHGGSVYVTSEPGKGAEFVCQFPNEAPKAGL